VVSRSRSAQGALDTAICLQRDVAICCASSRLLIGSESDTLAQFVASAKELGAPVARAAASVLAWRFLAYPGEDADGAFLSFAILLLAVYLEPGEDGGPWLTRLAAWVMDEESRARKAQGPPSSWQKNPERWLLGLTIHDQREQVWRALALQVLARPERPHPSDARQSLQLLGELVAGI
jgi:hypothetical protein